jgi:hypothetical protein
MKARATKRLSIDSVKSMVNFWGETIIMGNVMNAKKRNRALTAKNMNALV